MPTATYIALANMTLSSAATSVTFSSIPATYRDLVLVVTGVQNGIRTMAFRLNGDTGTNYPYVLLGTDGAGVESGSSTALSQGLAGRMSTVQSTTITHFIDYSATNKHKTVLSRYGAANDLIRLSATRWANTAAVTSIVIATLNNEVNVLQAGSTFALYGIVS